MFKRRKIILLLIIALSCSPILWAKKLPGFMKNGAYVTSTSYRVLGTRDMEFRWGDEVIWLSEIFQTWGRKGTSLLWKQLSNDDKLKVIESFGTDRDGRKYYFNPRVNKEMGILLKKEINWVALKEKDLLLWLPDKVSEILNLIEQFERIPHVVNDVNITGLSLYKEYTYLSTLLRQDTAGIKEVGYRLARLAFIDNSPVVKDATEAVLSVILESLINNMVTEEELKNLSPIAQTAVKFGTGVLKNIHEHPSFKSYEKNTRRLKAYYIRVMNDEIKTIKKLLKKLTKLDTRIRKKALEFSDFISTHVDTMHVYRDEAEKNHGDFLILAEQYRAQNLSGKISLMPQMHELKEQLNLIILKAERLHARSIEEVENVLAPGDPSSARRLLNEMRAPLDEIYAFVREISSEIDVLSQASGEINTLKQEVTLLAIKFKTTKKHCLRYYDFFHRGILLKGIPSYNPGDTSGALAGRPGLPDETRALAYSFREVLRLYEESKIIEQLYYLLETIIENYPVEDLENASQRNDFNETQDLLKKIQRSFINNKYFEGMLKKMRRDLLLFGIDEDDLLDLVRGRTPGLNPEFIETIEGQGVVPATK